MKLLASVLSLGHSDTLPEGLARRVRVSNGIAIFGFLVGFVSLPFDLWAAEGWILIADVAGMIVWGSCWVLNAAGHRTLSRVVSLAGGNLVILYCTIVLGEGSDIRVVFFALATGPFFVFDLEERRFIVPLVLLSIAGYFAGDAFGPLLPPSEFSVPAYRVYSAVLTFAGIVFGIYFFAWANRRAERALEEARARSVSAARLAALGEMSSGVAHEIRNPLAAIHLAAQKLVDQPGQPEEVAATGGQVQRVAMRISKIIDSLLWFARDATGDPFTIVDVERVFAETLELCRARFLDHRIELSVCLPPMRVEIECRAVQLSQVLLNLLSNAHDAVEKAPERWVRVDADVEGEELEISVADSGPGVPAAVRDRLFEPFFTTKPPNRGTGLGLSISRGIVEAHHGTLTLDATSLQTRFVVRIPLRQPPSVNQAAGSSAPPSAPAP